jgi:sec-independent protein translocase protein TatA
MFGIGMQELLIILVIALIVLGPTKLPGVARSIGKGLRELRRASDDLRGAIMLDDDDHHGRYAPPPPPAAAPPTVAPPTEPAPAPAIQGSQLADAGTVARGDVVPTAEASPAEPTPAAAAPAAEKEDVAS